MNKYLSKKEAKGLAKAKLISFSWSSEFMYFAKFRLANCVQYQVGPITIILRAKWLRRSSMALHNVG